ncbi:gliding motility lipoprotein GldD [Siansivirga zeaxanthinifaciens]|uniref:Gliding motility protein GldD n=1 Tax=Siansivirga zeaxanthinifaciens CC-SAMT-1 TaxID=1454006 RepID=A0A0C5VU24_9FLAO|nr:gliding motility lipoprotein GldD [Siansivirga zeaxanthinifaciens]AJR02676.1 gliding motility protein GldD [Siansivirga zeaxanthinifaciens CC-SAMT-1]
MKPNFYLLILVLISAFSCSEDYVPKPKAYLRLDYPRAQYTNLNTDLPFTFEKNLQATKINIRQLKAPTESYGINLEYPTLKGVVFITYKAIEGREENLTDYLRDAQKFTLEHAVKADEIPVYPFEDSKRKVYGVLSEVKGNVASPVQFYVTDSENHFLTGSLYFNAKPNYDSILPAINYMQKDIGHIMETLKWKN